MCSLLSPLRLFRYPALALLLWPLALGAWPKDVEHAFDTVSITDPPKRIVTLYQGATDTAVALGLEPVGVVESWTEKPLYRYLREELPEPRMLGLETQPDLEGIAWLQPDLIVGARHRHHEVYPLLAHIAPTVIEEDVYDFRATMKTLAHATGMTDRGQALLACWDARAEEFRSRIRRKLQDDWPPQVAILSFRGDHARIYYGGFARRVLDELGFEAPPAHRKDSWGIKLTSQESIPAMDAEVIFVFMQEADPAVRRTYDTWASHPLWQRLEAVRHNQVHQVDPVTWNMGGGILAAHHMLDDLYQHYQLQEAPDPC